MSYLPEISEQQRNHNIKKLINQNKKLRQQILVFQEQINLILETQPQQQKAKLSDSQITKHVSLHKRSSCYKIDDSPIKPKQKSLSSPIELTSEYINSLLETNSPFIETRVIPSLKQQVEELKCLNIKQNAHYILKEEDELKILKKDLYKFRKQKQVITSFIKDKQIKLEKQNTELINYKNSLCQQLNSTVKFNRQSNSQITELEREIRKYHFTLIQFKKLSSSAMVDERDKQITQGLKNNPSLCLIEVEHEIKKLKDDISKIQNKWKDQLDSIDKEYYQLKQQSDMKLAEERTLQIQQTFHKTRILVMKDQEKINLEKERQKLLKTSPKLQKQLDQYLKQQQQKLLKKQKYHHKHHPHLKEDEVLSSSLNKTHNPQNSMVESLRDDKNILKLKNYQKRKQKMDKQTQTNLKDSTHQPQSHRLERTWSNNQEQSSLDIFKQNLKIKTKMTKNKQQSRGFT